MSTIVANTITIPKRIFLGEYIKALLQNMIIIGYPLPTKKDSAPLSGNRVSFYIQAHD